MKYLLVLLLSLFCIRISVAQNKDNVLKDSINKQLELLYTFPQTLYGDEPSFDPDSLSSVIADNIIKYAQSVGFQNFNSDDFSSIELNDDSSNYPFSVISFGYDSGGTARVIPTSIIIKKDIEGYNYYNMTGYEADFYEIHQLRDHLYLCFATIPGWGACMNQSVSVFEFAKEMKFIPMFGKYSDFSVCNSNLSFDQTSMLLSITKFEELSIYFSSNKDVLKVFKEEKGKDSDGDYISILISKFDGEKFVKP